MTESTSLTVPAVKVSLLEKMKISPARVIAPLECDDISFQPPAGLYVAGFPWLARRSETNELGWEIDENLVDTVVAWSASGNTAKSAHEKVECVLEVDYLADVPAEDLIHLASSGEFSLSLVGLDAMAEPSDLAHYAARLKTVAACMLKAHNFSKSFYPFSNEFEALFIERMGKKDDAERMRSNWSKGLVDVKHPSGARVEYSLKRTPLGRVEIRQACLEALRDHFGGDEMLDTAVMALARPIAKRVESFTDELKAQPKAKQERFGLVASE